MQQGGREAGGDREKERKSEEGRERRETWEKGGERKMERKETRRKVRERRKERNDKLKREESKETKHEERRKEEGSKARGNGGRKMGRCQRAVVQARTCHHTERAARLSRRRAATTALTFEAGGAHGRHGRTRGLGKALEGRLLIGRLVRGGILLLLPLVVHSHGLQGQLLPAGTDPAGRAAPGPLRPPRTPGTPPQPLPELLFGHGECRGIKSHGSLEEESAFLARRAWLLIRGDFLEA